MYVFHILRALNFINVQDKRIPTHNIRIYLENFKFSVGVNAS